MIGNPDDDRISMSYVERQNLTMRCRCAGYHLTISFSKKRGQLRSSSLSAFRVLQFRASTLGTTLYACDDNWRFDHLGL
jgi:hypothetical protein